MRLSAEFTTEPFVGEGEPPEHARAALDAAQAAGLAADFGPLGTGVAGEADALLRALPDIVSAAFGHGATRVTLQVERDEHQPARAEVAADAAERDGAATTAGAETRGG